MTSIPPLKSLPVFLMAAKHQSFKVAAEQLFVTQAAVSQQIRLLEEFLGCQLFDRENKQVVLNQQGRLFLPHIEQAFNEIKQGVAVISAPPKANRLRITTLHSVASMLLMPNIEPFQLANPKLTVQFLPSNRLENFDDLDIGIRRGRGNYPGLESRKLLDDTTVLVASPLLVHQQNLDQTDILNLPILEDISSDVQEAIDAFCQQFSVSRDTLNIKLQTSDALPIIQHALAGQGLAFVSKALVASQLKNGNLINVLDFSYHCGRTLYLVAPSHHFKWEKVSKFEEWLRALLAN